MTRTVDSVPAVRATPHAEQVSTAAAIRAERRRFFSTSGPFALLAVAAVLPAITTIAQVSTVGTAQSPDMSTVDGIGTVLNGGFLASLMATLGGVLAVTTEWRYHTASGSVLAVGGRRTWLLAKLCVAVPFGLLASAVGQAVVLAIGLPMLSSNGIDADVWSGQLLNSTIGTVVLGGMSAVWGLGLGLLIRSQVAAVAGLIVYTAFFEGAVIQFVPVIGKWLPGGAQGAIALDPSVEHLAQGWGFLLFAGWAAAALVAGARELMRREL